MTRGGRISLILLLVVTLAAPGLRAAPLPQQAYLWQRSWTEPVRHALSEHGKAFAEIVVLKAEVTWRQGEPQLVQVPIGYETLRAIRKPIGLALRIGPYQGSFDRTNPATAYIVGLAEKIVAEAKSEGLPIQELQLDYDCASSKLEGFRTWVKLVRQRISPVPLVITTLPSWLDQKAFQPLVQATDGFVLQVHSLERPKSFDAEFSLCDPAAAQRAVARATEAGISFRVALPSYGYTIAFGDNGKFRGLSAEGPARTWLPNTRLKQVRAEPVEMARLVREWSSHPPAMLTGILWYRLPVSDDVLNWRWPTFDAILQQRIPRQSVRAESRRVEPGLSELSLVNNGELDISSRIAVQIRWQDARLVAGDGLHGFEMVGQSPSTAKFETGEQTYCLPAGERQTIGWLRLSKDREVDVELEPLDER